MKKSVKNKLIIISSLVLTIILLALLKTNVYISEYIFARAISRYYILIIGNITSFVPISLYEIVIVIAVVMLIIFLTKLVKNLSKKKYLPALNKIMSLTTIILSVVILYNITASFSYNRERVNLNITEQKPSQERVYLTAQYFMQDFNQLSNNLQRDNQGNIIKPYNFNELSKKLQNEYKKLDNGFFGYVPRAKPMIFSKLMSYMGFSGVFMSITAEPNVNVNIPSKDIPFVTAHEMAHSSGVMRENEANLVAYYLLLNSEDEYLRYSGYCASFSQMLSAVRYTCSNQQYNALIDVYSPLIIKEKQNANEYWQKHNSFFNGITNTINDLYLKISGIKEGIDSYENPYEVIDTGQVDNEGETIFDIEYSVVQKLYFTIYDNL